MLHSRGHRGGQHHVPTRLQVGGGWGGGGGWGCTARQTGGAYPDRPVTRSACRLSCCAPRPPRAGAPQHEHGLICAVEYSMTWCRGGTSRQHTNPPTGRVRPCSHPLPSPPQPASRGGSALQRVEQRFFVAHQRPHTHPGHACDRYHTNMLLGPRAPHQPTPGTLRPCMSWTPLHRAWRPHPRSHTPAQGRLRDRDCGE